MQHFSRIECSKQSKYIKGFSHILKWVWTKKSYEKK